MSEQSVLSDDVQIAHSERTAARVVEERAVVIVIDANKLHTLNATGTSIWENCDGKNVGEVASWFAAEYGLEPDVARRDLGVFLQELHAVGALELRGLRA